MKCNESTRRSAKEIEFDAGTFLKTLREYADHVEGHKKMIMQVAKVALPPPLNLPTASDRKPMKKELFRELLQSVKEAAAIERGAMKPSGTFDVKTAKVPGNLQPSYRPSRRARSARSD